MGPAPVPIQPRRSRGWVPVWAGVGECGQAQHWGRSSGPAALACLLLMPAPWACTGCSWNSCHHPLWAGLAKFLTSFITCPSHSKMRLPSHSSKKNKNKYNCSKEGSPKGLQQPDPGRGLVLPACCSPSGAEAITQARAGWLPTAQALCSLVAPIPPAPAFTSVLTFMV